MTELTQILREIDAGNTARTDELLPLVYDELRRIAAAKLAREAPGHTLQATALVHEAYLRLLPHATPTDVVEDDGRARRCHAAPGAIRNETPPSDRETVVSWNGRAHFFAAAAEAMRRILIEGARSRKRIKRGGDRQRVELDESHFAWFPQPNEDVLALDEAINRLERLDAVKAQVVKLRYFTGLTIEETAATLGISTPTVKRYWYYARAWLRREMLAVDKQGPGT